MISIKETTRKTIYNSKGSVFKNLFKIEMAASKSFEADLPELTEEQLMKLYTWGQSSCEAFDVRMHEDMSMVLIATRKKQDSVRGHMRLLRTNLLNWGVSLQNKQMGWLRLVADEGNSAGAAEEAAHAARNTNQTTPQASSCHVLPQSLLPIPMVAH